MTPITKNVRVVDEHGNQYEATYPKRAKGLVKNGRARFIDEYTICLACPPTFGLEDKVMLDETIHSMPDTAEVVANAPAGLTLDYVLAQIEKIITKTEHVTNTIEALASMSDGENADPYSPGNTLGHAKAEALGGIVRSREATNQQTLKFLEKMYDDLKPEKASNPFDSQKFEGIRELAEDLPPREKENVIRMLAGAPQNNHQDPGAALGEFRQIIDEVCSADWDHVPDEVRNAIAQGITAQLAHKS